ncbi:MAG: type II secretion system F family protein [Pseudonocardia sp.]|nr:type II secretion system F family protein [Pseudonocardia sp.]
MVGGWPGVAWAVPLGAGSAAVFRRVLARATVAPTDPLRLAAGWDLLAACLLSGLPVPVAVRAIADHLPQEVAGQLSAVAERLALGADPGTAWEIPESSPMYRLARSARRSAHSGAGLAKVAATTAADARASVRDAVAARGQRATVLITGPLGLCFLPAFLVLGVAPVVIGLAAGLAQRW